MSCLQAAAQQRLEEANTTVATLAFDRGQLEASAQRCSELEQTLEEQRSKAAEEKETAARRVQVGYGMMGGSTCSCVLLLFPAVAVAPADVP